MHTFTFWGIAVVFLYFWSFYEATLRFTWYSTLQFETSFHFGDEYSCCVYVLTSLRVSKLRSPWSVTRRGGCCWKTRVIFSWRRRWWSRLPFRSWVCGVISSASKRTCQRRSLMLLSWCRSPLWCSSFCAVIWAVTWRSWQLSGHSIIVIFQWSYLWTKLTNKLFQRLDLMSWC